MRSGLALAHCLSLGLHYFILKLLKIETLSLRGKICDELEDFMLEGDRERFSRELTDAEDWLYEDGEFADKKTYT